MLSSGSESGVRFMLSIVIYSDVEFSCPSSRIPRFQGQSEFTLSGEADLSAMTVKKAWSRPPISMDFQVLMFTASGLLVRFLKVFEKSEYQSVKWVRYMTKAGSYQIRVSNCNFYQFIKWIINVV